MKLSKIAFARLVGFLCHNGFSYGDWEMEELDRLVDIEVHKVPVSAPNTVSCESVDRLLQLMHEGERKIEAVKAYRVITGAGLKEAKDGVERYWNGDILGHNEY